jgi:hypothetical protein
MAKSSWWRLFQAEEPPCESKHGRGGLGGHGGSPKGVFSSQGRGSGDIEIGLGRGGEEEESFPHPYPARYLYLPLKPNDPAPEGRIICPTGLSNPGRPDHPSLDRGKPFKWWVYLDLEIFGVGEWLRIEVVTGERYYLAKFARIKLKNPNLDKFSPNKKNQRKTKWSRNKK